MSNTESAGSTSLPTKNDYVEDTISVQPTPEEVAVDKRYVHDTFTNKTALNIDRNGGVLAALKGYAQGSPIKVTYFHNQYTATDERTNDSDFAKALNDVHHDLLQINEFEFKLRSPFDFTFDNGVLTSTVRGTGIVYPGFVPVVADFFLYELEPGYMGLFKVDTQPSRLSIKTGTFHEIAFVLDRFVSSDDITQIKLRVSDNAWFDKQRFLNGEATLLLYDDYAILQECDKWISLLLDYYNDKFWEQENYETFLRPDKVYDPYVIDFLRKTVSVEQLYKHPTQLLPKHKNHAWTIWEKLLNPKSIPWELVKSSYMVESKSVTMWDVHINALMNRDYLTAVEDTYAGEIFDYVVKEVDGSNLDTYNEFEKLLCAYLNNGVINAKQLMVCVENYLNVSEEEQFYTIPILMFLMRRLYNGIKTGNMRFKSDTSRELPIRLPFTDTVVVDNEFSIISVDDQKVVSIVDETGVVWPLKVGYVYYTTAGIKVDLSDILAEREITNITGTWYIVLSCGGGTIVTP